MSGTIETIWVNDLDRTLLDSNRAFDLLIEVAAAREINTKAMLEHKATIEKDGGSFDATSYLNRCVEAQEVERIYEDFVDLGSEEDLLFDDVSPYLGALDSAGLVNIVLTYGGIEWQKAKLRAAGLDSRDHIITNRKAKGHLIADWRREGFSASISSARLGELVIRENSLIVLVDDKPASFEGLPPDCTGHLIRRSEAVLPSQAGELPDNVSTHRSLDELTAQIMAAAA